MADPIFSGYAAARYAQGWASSGDAGEQWFRLLFVNTRGGGPRIFAVPARWGRNRAALSPFGQTSFTPPPPQEQLELKR